MKNRRINSRDEATSATIKLASSQIDSLIAERDQLYKETLRLKEVNKQTWQELSDRACDEIQINNEYIAEVFQWIVSQSIPPYKIDDTPELIAEVKKWKENCEIQIEERNSLRDKISNLTDQLEEVTQRSDDRYKECCDLADDRNNLVGVLSSVLLQLENRDELSVHVR